MTKSGSIWIARDLENGDMQYAIFTGAPTPTHRSGRISFLHDRRTTVRSELLNDIAIAIAGRELAVGECVLVSCSESATLELAK